MAQGTYYGLTYDASKMLADLIVDYAYGHEFNGNTDVPNSPIAELPATLMDLHNSFTSPMPFGYDPHWDADGNWVP